MDDDLTIDDEATIPSRPRARRGRGPDKAPIMAPDRSTRRLAIGALLLAIVAVALTAWRVFMPSATPCQATAWSAVPAAGSLPAGWSTSATQYDPDRLSMTIVGPAPAAQTTTQPVVYATVSCFAGDAADAVTRAQAAAAAAGQTVSARSDLGDQGFTSLSAGGSSFIQFRHGNVVVAIAASGTVTGAAVETIASGFDRQLGGRGSTAVAPSAPPSAGGATPPITSALPGASSSAAPSAAAKAPELEALLPKTAGGVALSISSAVGSSVLGTDPGSRAIIAALTAAGVAVNDFHAAQAYDPTSTVDLSIVAFRAVGMKVDVLQKIVLQTWLAGTGVGVTTKAITLGGHSVTQVDYGDSGTTPYLATSGDAVVVITTRDTTLATAAVAALP